MNELEIYIDSLFKKHKVTKEIQDLKDEMYSNMIAKREDLILRGITEKEAIKIIKKDIPIIDKIVGDNQLTYVWRFRVECLQTILLFSILGWIFSMPLMIVGPRIYTALAFGIVVISLISYMVMRRKDQNVTCYVSVKKTRDIRKVCWVVWVLFFVVSVCILTGMLFSSNLWFHRPITFSGPYDLVMTLAGYYVLALTIMIPLAISLFPRILNKNVKDGYDE